MSDGVTGPALVGITGTRSGATPDQLLVLQAVLAAAFVPGAWLDLHKATRAANRAGSTG